MTESSRLASRTELGWVPGFLGALVAVLAVAAYQLPIAHDEAYYWTWSKALDWSYYDHPPGVAVVIALARSIFGEGKVALRFVSLTSSALIVVFVWLAAREAAPAAGRQRAGRLALLVMPGALMFTVGYLPATPDPVQGAALAAAAWSVGRTARGVPWAGGATIALFGCALLIKHSSALVAFGALLAALSHREGRRVLMQRSVLFTGVVTVGLVSAWLYVDLAAGDGATEFQAVRVFFGRPTRGLIAIPLTLGALALTFGPAATWGLAVAWLPVLRRRLAVRVWAGGAAGLVSGCLVAAWFGGGELNWPMPALAFGAPAVVEAVRAMSAAAERRFVGVSLAASLVGLVVLAHIVYPFAPISPRKDRTLRASGYDAVTKVVEEMAQKYGARGVVTRGYQSASQLRFHGRDRLPVLETASKRRSQYDLWARPSFCPGDVVIVAWNRRDLPRRLEGRTLAPMVKVTRGRAGRAVEDFFIQPIEVGGRALCQETAP